MNTSEPDKRVSKELQKIAKELNKRLEVVAGQNINFSLIVFNSEAGSRLNYISNAERKDVIQAMMSLLKGWGEGMPDIKAYLRRKIQKLI